jgi:site-specific DNA-methyltransferase (adenine-specific)
MQYIDAKKLAQNLGMTEAEVTHFLEDGHIEQNAPIPQEGTEPNLFLEKNDVRIFEDNFITSASLPNASVDLIVTSPPYNVGIDYSQHEDDGEYESYLEFSRQWLAKSYQLLRPDGRICMNIPLDKNKGGQQSICADLTTIAKDLGLKYHSTIIWNEGNISRRTAWGSWMSASAPYVIAPVEVIVVMYKDVWKKEKRPNQENNITRDEFMAWTNGIWTFNGESKKKIGHPAPFPRELPKRCIKLFSFVGETVVDPFMGSGTTLIEAWHNKRVGVGFDISKEYCELARKRLETEWTMPKSLKLL